MPCMETSHKPKYCQSTDTLKDSRKSQIMAILAISHVMKSITYKHQIHRFRVFRQPLEISALLNGRFIADKQLRWSFYTTIAGMVL
jgi:hypothetical protein